MMMVAVPFHAHAPDLQNYQAQCGQQQQQWQMPWQHQRYQQRTVNGFPGDSSAQVVVDTTLAADGGPTTCDSAFAGMCQSINEIFSAIEQKDPEVVRSTFQRVVASDAVVTWCETNNKVTGRDRITDYAIRTFQTIPDVKYISEDMVKETPRSVRVLQRVVGTATQADVSLPYFQAGKHACKAVSNVFTFDEEGRVKERQITLVFAPIPSPEPSMVDFILSNTLELAATPAGSRLLQEAVEKLDLDDQVALAELFHSRVLEASRSPSANFIMQKLIERLPGQRVQFIANEMTGCAVAAAQHRTQNRILEKLIEHCQSEYTERIIDELIGAGVALCTNAYGSFVIQSILVHGTEYQRSQLAEVILEDVHRLAKHKFGNNVVRTALEHSPAEQKHMLIEALAPVSLVLSKHSQYKVGSDVSRDHDTKRINDQLIGAYVALCTNAYGNLVVQSILVHGTEYQRSRLAQVILEDVHRLAKDKFGSNVVRTALVHSPAEEKQMLIEALTFNCQELAKLSRHKVGSFVARDAKVARKQTCN